jgi:hypothetical protein
MKESSPLSVHSLPLNRNVFGNSEEECVQRGSAAYVEVGDFVGLLRDMRENMASQEYATRD